MIPVSNEYRRQLIAGNRNWLIKVDMTLADGTILNLTNEHIWDNGIVLDEAISSNGTFDIGAAIVGSLKVVINNISGDFSLYDFYNATLTLWLGVEGDVDENDIQRYYRMGFYVVDVPTYNGSLITLNCLDNMTWFDIPFEEVTGITYPATAGTVVQAICTKVGVTLGTPTFPNYSNTHTRILTKPEQTLNCREVLQYIAQMCCCYCKIDTAGQLVLKWHDKNAIIGIHDYDGGTFSTTTTPYSDGDAVDGMLFDPWTTGTQFDGGTFEQLRDRAFISQNFEIEVSTDDVVITGCRVRNNTASDADKAYDELWVDSTLEQTHPRYVLIIDNNPFVTKAESAYIANIVGNTLAGLPVRGFTATSLADFSYETGDMATVVDFRGNRYYTWITHFTFTTNNSERFSCGVESIKKRKEQRFSGTVKTLAEANQNAADSLSAYDTAVKAMNDLGTNAVNFNEWVYPVGAKLGTSRTVWRYDGSSRTGTDADPKFPNSNSVFKITGDGVFVALRANGDIAADGTCTFSNGYDANSGTAILNTLFAKGINCNSIHAGTLTLGGTNNANGVCSVLDSNSAERVRLDVNGIKAVRGFIGNGSNGWTIQDTSIYNGCDSITSASNGTYVGTNGFRNKNGANVVTITSGGIDANHGSIGAWSINSDGLTNNANAWVKPMDISCGKYGAGTLIGMRGSNDHDGYLEVGVNSDDDYIHVHWDGITKKNNGTKLYAEWGSSDRRFKKNIKNLTLKESQDLISKCKPRKFEFKNEKGTRYGFIAQELLEVLDDSCGIEYGNYDKEDKETYHAIHYGDFVAPLCVIVNKQREEIDLLKQELAELKARMK